MSKSFGKIIIGIFLLFLLFLFLKYPVLCTRLAGDGLCAWYQTIIPSLFPFMVLTSVLQELHMDQWIGRLISPMMFPFFRYSDTGKYCILIGALCGFPMGAKTIAEQYRNGKLSRQEAQRLLPFCNQLSPAFFMGVIYPAVSLLLPAHPFGMALLLMYGIPFLYGILCQFQKIDQPASEPKQMSIVTEKESIAEALDQSLTKNILPIIKIGSYMIIFRVCNCLPYLFYQWVTQLKHFPISQAILQKINLHFTLGLEITTGILQLQKQTGLAASTLLYILFCHIYLGGVSCIMQTYTFLGECDLSMWEYCKTKILFGVIACCVLMLYFHVLQIT